MRVKKQISCAIVFSILCVLSNIAQSYINNLPIHNNIIITASSKPSEIIRKKALCDISAMYITINNASLSYRKKLLKFYKPYFSHDFYLQFVSRASPRITLLEISNKTACACKIRKIKHHLWVVTLNAVAIERMNSNCNSVYLETYYFLVKHLKQSIAGNYANLILDGFFSKPIQSPLTSKQKKLYVNMPT